MSIPTALDIIREMTSNFLKPSHLINSIILNLSNSLSNKCLSRFANETTVPRPTNPAIFSGSYE